MIAVYLALILLALLAGIVLFRRTTGGDRGVVNGSLPLLLVVLGASVWQALWTAPAWNWNAIRLAPALALWQGQGIYHEPGRGPVSGHIYMPVPVWLYLPAALLPTPSSAVSAAAAIAFLSYLAPAAWVLLRGRDGAGPPAALALRGYLLGLFLLITFVTPGLSYCATRVHVDGPAFGFATAAGAVLYLRPRPSFAALFSSALCAVLSVGCKQVMLPLLAALPIWLALAEGWRDALRWAVCLAVVGIVVAAAALVFLDVPAAWFNVVLVPAQHPLRGSLPTNLAGAFLEFQEHVLVYTSFLVLGGCYAQWLRPRGWNDWLAANRWSLLLLVALFLLPTALLGRLKIGGAVNAFSASAGFLALALCLCLRDGCGDDDEKVRLGFTSMTVVLASMLLWLLLQLNARAYLDFNPAADNEQEIVARYLADHPGAAYFPWDPLAHLVAEGKAYHFEYGVFDRELAGYPLGAEHFRAHVPPRARLLCVPKDRVADTTRRYLKEFARPVAVPELPGFDCWQAEPHDVSNSR